MISLNISSLCALALVFSATAQAGSPSQESGNSGVLQKSTGEMGPGYRCELRNYSEDETLDMEGDLWAYVTDLEFEGDMMIASSHLVIDSAKITEATVNFFNQQAYGKWIKTSGSGRSTLSIQNGDSLRLNLYFSEWKPGEANALLVVNGLRYTGECVYRRELQRVTFSR